MSKKRGIGGERKDQEEFDAGNYKRIERKKTS
jgi:hypothetical protein